MFYRACMRTIHLDYVALLLIELRHGQHLIDSCHGPPYVMGNSALLIASAASLQARGGTFCVNTRPFLTIMPSFLQRFLLLSIAWLPLGSEPNQKEFI